MVDRLGGRGLSLQTSYGPVASGGSRRAAEGVCVGERNSRLYRKGRAYMSGGLNCSRSTFEVGAGAGVCVLQRKRKKPEG